MWNYYIYSYGEGNSIVTLKKNTQKIANFMHKNSTFETQTTTNLHYHFCIKKDWNLKKYKLIYELFCPNTLTIESWSAVKSTRKSEVLYISNEDN